MAFLISPAHAARLCLTDTEQSDCRSSGRPIRRGGSAGWSSFQPSGARRRRRACRCEGVGCARPVEAEADHIDDDPPYPALGPTPCHEVHCIEEREGGRFGEEGGKPKLARDAGLCSAESIPSCTSSMIAIGVLENSLTTAKNLRLAGWVQRGGSRAQGGENRFVEFSLAQHPACAKGGRQTAGPERSQPQRECTLYCRMRGSGETSVRSFARA